MARKFVRYGSWYLLYELGSAAVIAAAGLMSGSLPF
jgi:hypothetical protein